MNIPSVPDSWPGVCVWLSDEGSRTLQILMLPASEVTGLPWAYLSLWGSGLLLVSPASHSLYPPNSLPCVLQAPASEKLTSPQCCARSNPCNKFLSLCPLSPTSSTSLIEPQQVQLPSSGSRLLCDPSPPSQRASEKTGINKTCKRDCLHSFRECTLSSSKSSAQCLYRACIPLNPWSEVVSSSGLVNSAPSAEVIVKVSEVVVLCNHDFRQECLKRFNNPVIEHLASLLTLVIQAFIWFLVFLLPSYPSSLPGGGRGENWFMITVGLTYVWLSQDSATPAVVGWVPLEVYSKWRFVYKRFVEKRPLDRYLCRGQGARSG